MQQTSLSFGRQIQQGFTLIEVLVTLALLAVGFLGMLSMQSFSLHQTHNIQFSTQATLLAKDIADSMRSNRDSALTGAYQQDLDDAIYETLPSCDAADCIPANDLIAWNNSLSRLPAARASITQLADDRYEIFVSWQEKKSQLGENTEAVLCQEDDLENRNCVQILLKI